MMNYSFSFTKESISFEYKVKDDNQAVFFQENLAVIQKLLTLKYQDNAEEFLNNLGNASTNDAHHENLKKDLEKQLLNAESKSYNTPLESDVLKFLREEFKTKEAREKRLQELIKEFGNKSLTESTKVKISHSNKASTKTISSAQSDVLDILCLAQLLFEEGDNDIATELMIQVLKVKLQKPKYPDNLDYLTKCLTNFKPAIYENIKEHFASKYKISKEQVKCSPKISGQQVGAIVTVYDEKSKENPSKTFYVKSHQEFCSKSDPLLGSKTSNGVGFVNLKELFMYKVLEKTGYGPKTEFMIDKDISQSGVEEGIMIITQDSGYTKQPLIKDKSFKTFNELKSDLQTRELEDIDDGTKKDIMVIDMISRMFLLEDAMINEGNFGKIEVKEKDSKEIKSKWKLIDFISPQVKKGKEYLKEKAYLYTNYYGGSNIAYGFKTGNFSHTYQENTPVNKILESRKDEKLLGSTLNILEKGKGGKKIGVKQAIDESLEEILSFLKTNKTALRLEDEDGVKERTQRRIEDLKIYCDCVQTNFKDLMNGITKNEEHEKNV